jgi:hypothetical protein
MFAFVPTSLATWEVIALSALCAVSALTIAIALGAMVAYLGTRAPKAVRQAAPARVAPSQPQPTGAIPPAPAIARSIG